MKAKKAASSNASTAIGTSSQHVAPTRSASAHLHLTVLGAKLRRDIVKHKNEVEAEVDGEGDGQVETPLACKEGELKCLAANDQGKDGGVFKCVNGMWDMFRTVETTRRVSALLRRTVRGRRRVGCGISEGQSTSFTRNVGAFADMVQCPKTDRSGCQQTFMVATVLQLGHTFKIRT
jgi:hypothetical protein